MQVYPDDYWNDRKRFWQRPSVVIVLLALLLASVVWAATRILT